ncbi:MAG: hypothetical protein K0R38_7116 [Polyangiaceae bacterium]|jgi:hypothetical protein|nr:hypothetical protein [Polyangiaceae bacterium]
MSSLQGLLERIVPALQNAGVPFMVAGSFASAAHGLPRSTNDLDIRKPQVAQNDSVETSPASSPP